MENLSAITENTGAATLDALRAAMAAQRIDAVLIPSADPHLSEYLPGRWKGREHLSGFTGSVGTLIVTSDFAGVWTDARYWDQAAVELAGSDIQLMKIPSGASLLYIDWLAEHLNKGQTVAVDDRVLGLSTSRLLKEALQARGIELRTDIDLLDTVWSDRPSLPDAPVYEHAAPYASQSRADRLQHVRAAMAALGADRHFVSTLDDLAWLFNLRGADVNFNPVFLAHALVEPERATLFVGAGKVPPELVARLQEDGVAVTPYENAAAALAALDATKVLLIDPRRITAGMRAAVSSEVKVVEAVNPSTFAKSKKSEQDAVHVRATMEQDGAALCEFFSWLEPRLLDTRRPPLTELDIDTHICAARERRPGFVSPSFGTIAGFNANGAVMHYRATEAAHADIEGDGLLLIDSAVANTWVAPPTSHVWWPIGFKDGQVSGAMKARLHPGAERHDGAVVTRPLSKRHLELPCWTRLARAPLWAEPASSLATAPATAWATSWPCTRAHKVDFSNHAARYRTWRWSRA